MPTIELPAPAKLNLTLDITGIAPDSYHTLDMVMHTISLCDRIAISCAAELELACPPWLPSGPGNLVWKAAAALREYAGINTGAHIEIVKHIPAQAGMGGGSADAAATLKGLNELWKLGLSLKELCGIGIKLGSDVPFALQGGTARVRGVGEAIEPIAGVNPLWFAIALPNGGVSTAQCYRRYDEVGAAVRPDNNKFVEALRQGDIRAMAMHSGNALERAAVGLLPAIGGLLAQMRATGAKYCAMTGSGAAVFSVFEREDEAAEAVESIKGAAWKAVARTYEQVIQ